MTNLEKKAEKVLFTKLMRFCAYRERCTSEVQEKLRSLGANGNQIERITERLTEENFLNDRRFAQLFTNGKFKLKR